MAATTLTATLTTKNDNSTRFSQPVGDSSKKCTLPLLRKGLENMKDELNLTLTALVESEKSNGDTKADVDSDGNTIFPIIPVLRWKLNFH